jgi:hypothetical protein
MIYIYDNFLTEEECIHYINFHNKNISDVRKYRDTFVIQNDEDLEFPKKMIQIEKYFCVSLNYWQIVKWPPKSFQDWHYDGEINRENEFTGILYLNDDFVGGETLVENEIIKPKKGTFIFFQGSRFLHGVKKVELGNRYTIPCWFRTINN